MAYNLLSTLRRVTMKTVALAVFIFSTTNVLASSNSNSSTMRQPNFAFPKTVEENSRKNLEKALNKGDQADALYQAMNLVIATDLISLENVEANISELKLLQSKLSAPYSGLADLLLATLYSNIYLSDRWTFDNRNVPEELADSNPNFWDRNIFSRKVTSLVADALAQKEEAEKLPLSQLKSLVEYSGDIKSFTAYDFIVYTSIDILRTLNEKKQIPFYSEKDTFIDTDRLIDNLLALHRDPSEARNKAIVTKAKSLPLPLGAEYLWQQIKEMKESRFVAPLLVTYYTDYLSRSRSQENDNDAYQAATKELYAFAKEALKTCGNSKPLKELISVITNPEVKLSFESAFLPGDAVKVKMDVSNLNEFYLLLVRPTTEEENVPVTNLKRKAEILSARKISLSSEIPFAEILTEEFKIDDCGSYSFQVSTTPDFSGILTKAEKVNVATFIVSDFDLISSHISKSAASEKENATSGIFVVNSSDSSPRANQKVEFKEQSWEKGRRVFDIREVVTDSNGFAPIPLPFDSSEATVKLGSVRQSIYASGNTPIDDKTTLNIRFFPDRQIYRPGDTMEFMAVLYNTKNSEAELATNREVTVILKNTNWENVDTLKLVSDSSGRIRGSFQIPKDGLLGEWHLVTPGSYYTFSVEEYKTPSFLVTLEQSHSDRENSLEFTGHVATYSGMPLPMTRVDFNVDYFPYFFRWMREPQQESFSSQVETDANGDFKITLPLEHVDREKYRGLFKITATATDTAGETQQSPSVSFWLRQTFTLSSNIPEEIEVDKDSIQFEFNVRDESGAPHIKEVHFELLDGNKEIVTSGDFKSPLLTLPVGSLASGRYTLKAYLVEDPAIQTDDSFILYRQSDAMPPVDTALWVPRKVYIVPAGGKSVDVKLGSSYANQHVLCTLTDSNGTVKQYWTVVDAENTTLSIPAPADDARIYVTLSTCHNHSFIDINITIIPEVQTKALRIKTETFRSSLTPGSQETWKFSLSFGDEPSKGYAYALLYDKALDALADLRWETDLYGAYYPSYCNLNGNYFYNRNPYFGIYAPYPNVRYPSIDFNTQGYSLYTRLYYTRAARLSIKGMSLNDGMVYEDACFAEPCEASMNAVTGFGFDDMAEEAGGESEMSAKSEGAADGPEADEIQLRPIEFPVAFFRPDLAFDSNGQLEITFDVPNFNTTWNFIMGAYDDKLESASVKLEAVASKKVMVKLLPPRLLRTGDNAVISATVFNNTPESRLIDAVFEIFNPLTDEIIKSETRSALEIEGNGNKVVNIAYHTPDDINVVGLRVYARTEDSSDGEQTVIPVIPSSQPLIESTPFFLRPGQESFEMNLPETSADSKTTLRYCDNPIWEVVKALPGVISPESASLSSLIYSLYANCVGHGLAVKYPQVREALSLIASGEAGDSILISNLEKDADLKLVTLNNTPWVNNAASETLKLANLVTLNDDALFEQTLSSTWRSILNLQNYDGGFSWCPDMKSSRWITEIVLQNLALLKGEGYLPDLPEVDNVISRAIRFVDEKVCEEFQRSKAAKKDYTALLPYLYVRSFFPQVKMSEGFAYYRNSALTYIQKHWEGLLTFYKATAAITLYRSGKKDVAATILKSIKEYSSESPEKGVWFDTEPSSMLGSAKLLVTARVLTAFNEIQPSDSIVEGLRQWLILERQTSDWNEGLWCIDAVNAVLTSGSDWTQITNPPVIKIDGEIAEPTAFEKLTGDITLNLNSSSGKQGTIEINRSAPSPAWGAVINQYVAPIVTVKPAEVPDLSITKEIWVKRIVDGETKFEKADSFKKGDKVTVALIIDCGKDMDYVALTDERSACVEPLEQVSSYDVIDGLWCYREVRNASTNIFFEFLPRGRHIVTYEASLFEAGEFANGVASLQCLYAPGYVAHSAGDLIKVSE